jgi:hypothetical protein
MGHCTVKYTTTASFHILSTSPFSDHPPQIYIVRAVEKALLNKLRIKNDFYPTFQK